VFYNNYISWNIFHSPVSAKIFTSVILLFPIFFNGVNMGNENNTKNRRKSNIIGLILFFFSTLIILAGYLPEALSWEDTPFITAQYALIFTGICITVLIAASFIISLFPRRISVDKKVLVNLGLIAVAFGISGITGLVFQNEISFIDAIYKTFQLFVGEFGDISYKADSFPLLLNISRFLALFVTFGAITVLVLREKISQLSIRLFYRDVVIISDSLDKRITALSKKLSETNRKIVIGLIKPTQEISFGSNEQVPVIEFDVDKTLSRGLNYCNVKRSKCIYLFCNNTADNIILYRAVRQLLNNKKRVKIKSEQNAVDNDVPTLAKDAVNLLYSSLANHHKIKFSRPKVKQKIIKCFIQYKTYSEKEYYSIDNSLSGESGRLETYFINPDINALRQMISSIELRNLVNIKNRATADDVISRMNSIKIGIAGSGMLLESAAYEIPRLCSFSDSEKLELHFIGDISDTIRLKATLSNSRLGGCITVHNVNLNSSNSSIPELDILFICSKSEMQIKTIIHSVFQLGLYRNLKELLILTEGNRIEFDILHKYISNLAGQFPFVGDTVFSSIHLGNTVDLIMSIDDFYSAYGPDIHSVHEAYKKSISKGLISDFNKLPEELIESNLLTSIHNHLILGMLSSLFLESSEDTIKLSEFEKIIEHLAAVEHERWYRERLLQGYILSDSHDYLLNKNPYLKHWTFLDEDMKQKNKLYLLNTLQIQHDKQTALIFDVYMPNLISQLRYSPDFERSKNEL